MKIISKYVPHYSDVHVLKIMWKKCLKPSLIMCTVAKINH